MSRAYKALMNLVGNHHQTFRGGVPEARTMRTKSKWGSEHVVANINDGYELWFGYPNQWKHHVDEREARRLFWWLLFRWFGQARWFGLRRPIYYWALHRHVAPMLKAAKAAEDARTKP